MLESTGSSQPHPHLNKWVGLMNDISNNGQKEVTHLNQVPISRILSLLTAGTGVANELKSLDLKSRWAYREIVFGGAPSLLKSFDRQFGGLFEQGQGV